MVSNNPRCNHQMVTFHACACNAYQTLLAAVTAHVAESLGTRLSQSVPGHLLVEVWPGDEAMCTNILNIHIL